MRRFAPGETVLRAVRLAGVLARDDFFTSSDNINNLIGEGQRCVP